MGRDLTDVHIVRRIRFLPRTNDGPLVCTCGKRMLASTFAAHRKKVNARTGVRISDLDVKSTVWRRSVHQ